jgi:hypothetical protein
MINDSEELTFFLIGNNKDFLTNCIKEIEEKYKLNLNIKIINDIKYNKEDYCNCFYDNINEAFYFNTFILDYSSKEEIQEFFKEFNKNYNKTYIKFDSYPFFLINEKIYNKKELIKYINKINENRPSEYHIQSKDILIYDNENSLKNKIIKIYKYYTENEDLLNQSDEDDEKTLNILLCGIKGVGKTFFMNKLLFENRGLSKDNNYTSKLNKYRHKLFPISFYDIPGFEHNEDREMSNAISYINQFNKQYEKIKSKIHIIFYLFNCDSSRLLQDTEIELIKKFLTYNIPIYFIGNKSNPKDEKTFKRGILFNLKKIKSNLPSEYFKSHIFCINDKNDSIYLLLSKISEELEISKNAHTNIINEYEENNYISDCIDDYYSEQKAEINNNLNKNIHQEKILNEMKKSIFFNNLSYSISRIQEKILNITEERKKKSWAFLIPFKSLDNDLKELANNIEKEYKKLINEKDIKKIEKEIEKYSNKKDFNFDFLIDSVGGGSFILTLILFNIFAPLIYILPVSGIILISNIINKNKNNKKVISNFSQQINNEFLKRITLYDIIYTKLNAEKFNEIIEKFNEYIKHFQTENENDIDLLDDNNN